MTAERSRRLDAAWAAALFAAGLLVAMAHLASWGGRPQFHLQYYGPSVMVALGQGYAAPKTADQPAMRRFLREGAPVLDPAQVVSPIATEPLSQYQRLHRYSMTLVGLLWRVFGIRWGALHGLLGVMHGAAAVLAFLLFRMAMGRLLAVPLAAALICSPTALFVLPHYRDYSKAPFLLGALLLMAIFVHRRMAWPARLAAAAALGLCIGIGLGFRQDLLLCMPAAAITIGVLSPGPIARTWRARAATLAVLSLVVVAAGWPVLRAGRDGTNSYHNIALGWTTPFHQDLGLGGAPYETGYRYWDAYAHTLVSSYARLHGAEAPIDYWSQAHNDAARTYVLDLMRTFPADFVSRWNAAMRRVLDWGPFAIAAEAGPDYGRSVFVQRCLAWRWAVFGPLVGHGFAIAMAAILLLAAQRRRYAIAALFVLWYFGGSASLQYHVRHYFYLETLLWWSLGFALWRIAGLARQCLPLLWNAAARADRLLQVRVNVRRPIRNVLQVAGLAALAVYAPLLAALPWQRANVGALYDAYAKAPRTALEIEPGEDRWAMFRPKGFLDEAAITPAERALKVQTGLLAVTLDPGDAPFAIDFVYDAEKHGRVFNHSLRVPARLPGETGLRTQYFAVYNTVDDTYFGQGRRRFSYAALAKPHAHRLKGMARIDRPQDLPWLGNLQLTADASLLPRRIAARSDFAPVELRARAGAANLLINGSFERWGNDPLWPEAARCDSTATRIAPERVAVAGGETAVRQTWSAADGGQPPVNRFYVYADREQPAGAAAYEMAFDAAGDAAPGIYAAILQVDAGPDGAPRAVPLLRSPALAVEAGPAFITHYARFSVPAAEGRASILWSPLYLGQAPNASIVWDRLRLYVIHEPGPRWQYLRREP